MRTLRNQGNVLLSWRRGIALGVTAFSLGCGERPVGLCQPCRETIDCDQQVDITSLRNPNRRVIECTDRLCQPLGDRELCSPLR